MAEFNESSEEEEDYMSEKFLNFDIKVEQLKPARVIREIELDKKRIIANANNKQKSKKHLEEINRQKALEKKIDSSNLGYQMLLKMGYKEGEGLGLNKEGAKDPIKLTIKKDRSGLGMTTEINKTTQLNSALKRLKNNQHLITTDIFLKKLKKSNLTQQNMKDILAARKACRHLDEYKNLENPAIKFWPDEEHCSDSVDSIDSTQLVTLPHGEVILDEILDYLRNIHFYCIYCGTSYNDTNDMNENCPGKHKESH